MRKRGLEKKITHGNGKGEGRKEEKIIMKKKIAKVVVPDEKKRRCR